VDVCPVDCIHPRKDEPEFQSAELLYIHPDECIDCGACVPACPVEAIFTLDETPEKWKSFIPVNANYQKPGQSGRMGRAVARRRITGMC
jgi:ferredoxin